MRTLLLIAVVALQMSAQSTAVVVDGRVELLSMVARLAGFPEYNEPAAASLYTAEADRYFAAHREHPAVKALKELRSVHGVSFDAVPSLALHLTEVPELEERLPFEKSPERLDTRWKLEPTRAFLKELRAFATVSKADVWIKGSEGTWKSARERLAAKLGKSTYPAWMARFFGEDQPKSIAVVAGLFCGPRNYGVGVRLGESVEEFRPVLGCTTFDAAGLPTFERVNDELFAHELAHSYANRIVDVFGFDLDLVGASLLGLNPDAMRKQAYTTPRILMYETLVRSVVIQGVKELSSPEAAGLVAVRDFELGFTWVPDAAKALNDYVANKSQYATLRDYMPNWTAALEHTAKTQIAAMTKRPQLVSTTPHDGDAAVDPETKFLVLEFDRPMMDGSWSITGSKDDVPEITGKPQYDAARKVLTIPVKLRAGRSYRIGLNSPTHSGFKSESGETLVPRTLLFATRI